eukprot:4984868-Pyramimonas_sp.AAC.1
MCIRDSLFKDVLRRFAALDHHAREDSGDAEKQAAPPATEFNALKVAKPPARAIAQRGHVALKRPRNGRRRTSPPLQRRSGFVAVAERERKLSSSTATV